MMDSLLLDHSRRAVFLYVGSVTPAEVAPVCASLFGEGVESATSAFVEALRLHKPRRDRPAETDLEVVWRDDSHVGSYTLTAGTPAWVEGMNLVSPGGPWMKGGFWVPGRYRLFVPEPAREQASPAFDRLLSRLRKVAERGPIPAIGSGAPSVGLTLRSELEALGQTQGYHVIEVSATRLGRGSSGRRSLFSRVPTWVDGDRTDFLDRNGAYDKKGRWVLNKSIYAHRETAGGWQLFIKRETQQLELARHGIAEATWPLGQLEEAFAKYHERVFVYANALGHQHEKFHYVSAVHATGGSFERYLRVLEDGGGCFDLTLSRLPSGLARDHGFLFRVEEVHLPRMYEKLVAYDLLVAQ